MRKVIIPIILVTTLSANPIDWLRDFFVEAFTITEEQRIEAVKRGDRAAHLTPKIMTEVTHVGPDGFQIKGKTRPLTSNTFYPNKEHIKPLDPNAPSYLDWDAYLEWVNKKHETP